MNWCERRWRAAGGRSRCASDVRLRTLARCARPRRYARFRIAHSSIGVRMAGIEILPVDGLSRFLTFCRFRACSTRARRASRLRSTSSAGRSTATSSIRISSWSSAQEFLAQRDGATGSAASRRRSTSRHRSRSDASRAQFGSLDAIDDLDVVAALTQAAEAWLARARARSASTARSRRRSTRNAACWSRASTRRR